MLMGRLDEALEYLEEGEKLFKDLNDEEGAGWCMGMRGWVLLMRGDVLEAGAIAETIEYHLTVEHPEYAAHSGFALELMRVLRAYVEVLRGKLGAAETIARAAVDDGEWSSATWAQALGHYPLAAAALLQHRFGAARAAIEAGANAARQNGDPFYVGLFRYSSAWLALEEGRLDDASRINDELISHGEIGRVWAAGAGARYLQARIAIAQGRTDDAHALLSERLGSRNIGLVSEAWTGALLAELLVDRGDLEGAMKAARAAVDTAGGGLLGEAVAHRALATVMLAAGDAGGAEESIRHELDLLADSDWAVERARALAVLARVLDQQRRHDEAADAFDRARAALDALPADADRRSLEVSLLG
jgi:tetratricopeptide (TPR) repeat protein